IRCEVLAGKLLYALALDGAGSTFDLCPADVCMVDKPTITLSQFHPPPDIVRAVERVAVMSGLDVGGIAYMVDDRDGRATFYDLRGTDQPALDAWSTAAALAAVTETLELMVAVRPNFHHPALLAKQGANIDRISNGRLALNVVSSWWREEAESYGLQFDEHDV